MLRSTRRAVGIEHVVALGFDTEEVERAAAHRHRDRLEEVAPGAGQVGSPGHKAQKSKFDPSCRPLPPLIQARAGLVPAWERGRIPFHRPSGNPMKVPVNSIRAGNVIDYNGRLWVASKVQHISPGKGGAFVAIE